MDFLKSAGLWALFTNGPVLVLIVRGGRINGDQLSAFLLLFLVPFLGTILLRWLINWQKEIWRSVLLGSALGFAIPALGGYLLSIIVQGFESPAIFTGALMLSVPSVFGGALAGWILGRSAALEDSMLEGGRSKDL